MKFCGSISVHLFPESTSFCPNSGSGYRIRIKLPLPVEYHDALDNQTLTILSLDAGTLVEKGATAAADPGAQDSIVKTASIIDQKDGATGSTVPPEIPPVTVTAVDSTRRELSRHTIPGRFANVVKRARSDYTTVFTGTGTGLDDRDGLIEGTAYLTFTLVDNSTYNIDACLAQCDSIPQCVFVNLYYEYNNPGLNALSSNLKCAIYGDVHTAAEKTNRGGQKLGDSDALTYIQESSGFAADFGNPATPDGYELVFGPLDGANNAPGYMGFAFLDRYDVDACAQLCNTRGADGSGGVCQFVNIWRAVVNGNPTTYTCSFYYVTADASTAVNFGQGDLKVTFSRGYRRKTAIIDGGFELDGLTGCTNTVRCFIESDANWIGTSVNGGHWDALLFDFPPFAHSGHSVATLGSGDGADDISGSFTPVKPLVTEAGKDYVLQFFHNSNFNTEEQEQNSKLDVLWNGEIVKSLRVGSSPWAVYQVQVTAIGNDKLEFIGGSYPAYDFVDDVSLFRV
ncbi:hypothetical protein C8J56DRAFT_1076194 [Mycena floridula]|nr:hypothetical protein C8J56DRAFT_1076194 [Mycena floridula]